MYNVIHLQEDNSALVFSYIHKRSIYSMSLQERASYDIGYTKISFGTGDKELNALSNRELEEKINSLKAPKWNDKYEYIEKRNKLLLIILCYFPLQIIVNILYIILKSKEPKQ